MCLCAAHVRSIQCMQSIMFVVIVQLYCCSLTHMFLILDIIVLQSIQVPNGVDSVTAFSGSLFLPTCCKW